MSHHNFAEEGGAYVSLALTLLASIWTSVAMEVVHGIITLVFGLATCAAVFFLNRYLKKRYK